MRRRNLFLMAAAVFTILVWSSAAFAVDTVTMNVTSEPIHYQSPSDKGGGLTFTFDAGTILAVGDIITGDLTYGVTLAQSININVGMGGYQTPWTAAGVPLTGSPFTYNGAAPTQVGAGIYFNVAGTVGSQRVTVTVMGTAGDSLTVGPAAGVDQLVLTVLDQATNAIYTTPGVYSAVAPGPAATLSQNTLCINVSAYTGTTVLMSMDSAGDKFTFVPSNPEIAHVVEALNIAFVPCKGQAPGYIPIGSKITQGSETCVAFDNDHEELSPPMLPGVDDNGFCTFTHIANDIILGSNIPYDIATYTVRLDILVNGVGGNNGVYFSNEPLAVGAYNTNPGCGLPHTDMTGTYTYLNGLMAPATPALPNYWQCDVLSFPDQRAVTLITDATAPEANLGIVLGTEDFLAFNLPAFNYDLDEITAGDVVSVQITISKIPCGTIFIGTWQIGTFGCQSAPQLSGLLFPYFTEIGASADLFWDGIAITNPGMTATTTVLITVFEKDGDSGTYSLPTPIAANSQYVALLSSIPFVPAVGNTGTLGDSTCYVRVNVTGVSGIDGFGMIARQDTGESMGYLPRQMSF